MMNSIFWDILQCSSVSVKYIVLIFGGEKLKQHKAGRQAAGFLLWSLNPEYGWPYRCVTLKMEDDFWWNPNSGEKGREGKEARPSALSAEFPVMPATPSNGLSPQRDNSRGITKHELNVATGAP
jgi:hypothetical protein